MKQAIIVLSVFFSVVLCAVTGMTQEKGSMAKPGQDYNPAIQYSGFYKQDVLFFRNSPKDPWHRIPRLGSLRRVKCAAAADDLKTEGMWKGHLNADGTCGAKGEPSDWALGNRINFDEQTAVQK